MALINKTIFAISKQPETNYPTLSGEGYFLVEQNRVSPPMKQYCYFHPKRNTFLVSQKEFLQNGVNIWKDFPLCKKCAKSYGLK